MKNFICCLLVLLPAFLAGQTKPYFQQQADFQIDVSLNPHQKTLNGFVQLDYTNHSPDTLTYIWFHLWPNAYKNDRTAFSEQLLILGRTDFYFSDESEKGYINKLNFEVDGHAAILEDHPRYIDVARLILPKPLLPGQTIRITTPFHEQLPFLFSRGGYDGDDFMITQWYPKPAVYDRDGWHPMPYLDQGEFYSEFGDYTVNITTPKSYQVAATGIMTGAVTEGTNKTVTYHQNNVHDFAWFASRDFVIDSTTIQSASGEDIKLFAYYNKASKDTWQHALTYIEEAIRVREKAMGPYPYETITAVEAPPAFSGGMEYPTITSIQRTSDDQTLNELINHEVGHNWNYGILASNERDHPWMDEGMNSFYTDRFISKKYGYNILHSKKNFIENRLPDDYGDFVFRYQVSQRRDQPIALYSAAFSPVNYFAIVYYKAAIWMQALKDYLGPEMFQKCMHAYYATWKFKHPSPEDFKEIVAETSQRNVDSIFNLLHTKGDFRDHPPKKLRFQFLFDASETDKYNYIFAAPAIGANHYDGIMGGIVLHNYTLPEPAFHFMLAPMYGFRSQKPVGIGRIGYTIKSYGLIRRLETSLAFSHFNMREYTDSTGKTNFMDFSKLTPAVRLTFKNRDPLNPARKYLQWKTYLIRETTLRFQRDSIANVDLISYPRADRYINELSFVNENNRALYPYSYQIQAQQGDGFFRLALDVSQYFNYVKEGGLNARLFAGKLFYFPNAAPRYKYRRYQFNMTGPDGYEDYTYSNYFIGRNEFEGVASQQIMIRDGGFKVRTDLLSNKVGTSDNWLTALNLTSDIPDKINPLSVLPLDITLKAFFDVGTYAGAWQKEAETGKFLYDAGLQISMAKDLVNIYIPILYSKVYRDYYKQTVPREKRFWNSISFSIDIQRFRLKKLLDIPN